MRIYTTKDVVRLLVKPHKRFQGLSRNEIADALRMSRQAVSRHVGNGSGKRGTPNGEQSAPARKAPARKVPDA